MWNDEVRVVEEQKQLDGQGKAQQQQRAGLPVGPLVIDDQLDGRVLEEPNLLALVEGVDKVSSNLSILVDVLDIEELHAHGLERATLLEQLGLDRVLGAEHQRLRDAVLAKSL